MILLFCKRIFTCICVSNSWSFKKFEENHPKSMNESILIHKFSIPYSVETSDESPVAIKLKKMWLKLPVCEEQAVQSTVDDSMGNIWHNLSLNVADQI